MKKTLLFLFLCFPLVNYGQTYTTTTFAQGMTTLSAYDTEIWNGVSTSDDVFSAAQSIGFTFNYFGTDYTNFYVSTNGFMSFSNQVSSYPTNDNIQTATVPNNIIAPWWDDLTIKSQGTTDKVGYALSGSAPNRILTLEWFSASRYGGSTEYYYFQVKLYETTNVIEFHYGTNVLNGSESATIGIENADGSTGYVGPAGQPNISSWPANNYRFTPEGVNGLTLYNTSADGTSQTAFNHIKQNTTTPMFTASATSSSSFNRFQIELNTESDYSGTSYTETFSGTYSSDTKYDLSCTGLSPLLPASANSYFVRIRASNDGGSTWSAWSSDTWVYTYGSSDIGYHFTTTEQFNLGSLVAANYGNYITTNNNGTPSDPTDDYLEMGEGSFSHTASTSGVYEGGWYPSSGYTYTTIGYQSGGCGTHDIDVGVRFSNLNVPKGADVTSTSLTMYGSTGCGCWDASAYSTLLRAHDMDNASALSSSLPSFTRTTASKTFSGSSTNNVTVTSFDVVVEEVINRAGWSDGNAFTVIIDNNGGANSGCLSQASSGSPPQISGTFSGFENDIQFPNIDLAQFQDATSWNEIVFDVDKSSCGACDVTFTAYDASDDSQIATGNTSPLSLGGNTAASIYVIATIKRNNSPKLNSFTVRSTGGILPVELESFDVKCDTDAPVALWKTRSEINNDYFIIERSEDGFNYVEIDKVSGYGNSNELIEYISTLPTAPNHSMGYYYRLKQVDYDGQITILPTKYIDCLEGNHPIQVEVSTLNNKIAVTADSNYFIEFYDLFGRLIERSNQVSGSTMYNCRHLPTGVYLVVVKDSNTGEILESKKLIHTR